MKKFLTLAASATVMLAAQANAADLGQQPTQDSLYDDVPHGTPFAPSGLYLKGDLGIANGERATHRQIDRQLDAEFTPQDFNANGNADEADAWETFLGTSNIPYTRDGNTFTVPFIADSLGLNDDQNWSSTVFGGEISYLYRAPRSRFGFELGVGATFYNDDSATDTEHNSIAGTYQAGTAASEFVVGPFNCSTVNTCAGDTSHFTQSGFLDVERNYDIDLTGRVHFFAVDRLSVYGGGGISWAKADIMGANGPDSGGSFYQTAFNESKTSLGYVLNFGTNYWLTDNATIMLDYTYKRHKFDAANGNSRHQTIFPGVLDVNHGVTDNVDIEDNVHAVKVRLGVKLN